MKNYFFFNNSNWIFAILTVLLLSVTGPNGLSQEKPGPGNTGPTGTLSPMKGGTINTDGKVIENMEITGQLDIKANNVTIRNCIIDANNSYYGIRCNYGATDLLIEDCEIINMRSAGIYGENFTARRCNIHESDGDALKPKTNCLVEYCWIHHLGKSEGAHADGVQVRGAAANMVFRYNNFDMPSNVEPPYKSNSAFILQPLEETIQAVIEYNWINGGSFTMNLGKTETYVRHNKFGRDYNYGIFYPGGNLYNSCNTWEDTGEAIDECTAVVPVTGVTISASSLTLFVDQSSTLSATVSPDDASNKSVSWSSDNTVVATVDASGSVKAIADGDAKITVTTADGGYSASCNISVSKVRSEEQLICLGEASGSRLTVTDIQWPENIGEASVCLWNDDKTAAVSLSIDDNIENQHDWWLEMQDKYPGLKFTWFVIDSTINPANWYKYQKLVDEGNNVQGHGRCAINDLDETGYEKALDGTIEAVEANIPGTQCLGYAYPCGDPRYSGIASQKFIIMRGTQGLMNEADKIDYANLHSRSGLSRTSDVDIILREEEYLYSKSYYRGWLSYHYHTVQDKAVAETFLSYLSSKSDSVWTGTHVEVAKYGQSRDTHSLSIEKISGSEIKFTLTDKMYDEYFDFPLTVKVRIDNAWTNVAATQNGENIEVKVLSNGENQYALVKAVPDRGQVILTGEGGSEIEDIAVTGVNISQASAKMVVGQSITLVGDVQPGNADNKEVIWSSDNTSVATVDANGLVKALVAGMATLTVTTVDGNFTATCVITVSTENNSDNDVISITASNKDRWIWSDGVLKFVSSHDHRVGGAKANADGCAVYPFELPELKDGEAVLSGNFSIFLNKVVWNPKGNVDMYGLPYRDKGDVVAEDYWQGEYGTDDGSTALQDDFATINSPGASVIETNEAGEKNIAGYINAQYEAGAKPGDYVFIRLNPDVADVTDFFYWEFYSSDAGPDQGNPPKPTLLLEIGIPEATSISVTNVSLSSSELELTEGQAAELIATIAPADAEDKTVSWSSDNTSIASVDENGKVTAGSKGSATITVTTNDGKYTAYCVVNVTKATVAVKSVAVEPGTLSLYIDQTSALKATVSPEDATNKSITWTSENPEIATVDESGTVKAVATGSTSVIATTDDGSFSASCQISIQKKPEETVSVTGIEISDSSIDLEVGITAELTITVVPENASDQTVSWSTSNTGVATVDENGFITALSEGTATITVTSTDGGFSALCEVTVKQKNSSNETSIGGVKQTVVSVWPNPVTGSNLYFEIQGIRSGEPVTMQLMDITGKVALSKQFTIAHGVNVYSVNIQGITKGLYLMRIGRGANTINKKIIIRNN